VRWVSQWTPYRPDSVSRCHDHGLNADDYASSAMDDGTRLMFETMRLNAEVAARRERWRGYLGLSVIATIPIIVVTSCIAFLFGALAPTTGSASNALTLLNDIKDFAVAALSPVAGISGAILGFYFGEKVGEARAAESTGGTGAP